MANFYGLRFMAFLYSSDDVDEAKRKENIEPIFMYFPNMKNF